MTQLHSIKALTFVLLVSLVVTILQTTLQAVFAQKTGSPKPATPKGVVTELIEPLSGVRVNKGRPSTWRFSIPVHKDITARGWGTQFTVTLEIPPQQNSVIERFAARPWEAATEIIGWYTHNEPESKAQQVVMGVQLPLKKNQDAPLSKVVVDVECEGCDTYGARLTYSYDRLNWESLKKKQYYENFWNRSPEPGTYITPEEKKVETKETRFWELSTIAENLCNKPFDGVIGMYLYSTDSVSFHWKVHGLVKEYEAVVGRNASSPTIVAWNPQDNIDICKEAKSKISLHLKCKNCILDEYNVQVYLPNQPEAPQGVSSEVTNLEIFWQSGGICNIDSRGNIPTASDAFFRLWFDSTMHCEEPVTSSASMLTAFDWSEKHKVVRRWEAEIMQNPQSLGRSFANVPKCLCERLKGVLYHVVTWNRKQHIGSKHTTRVSPALRANRSTSENVSLSNTAENVKFVVPKQRIQARRDPSNRDFWHVVGNINMRSIRCAKQPLSVRFALHADAKILNVESPLQFSGRMVVHFDSRAQVVEVTLKPQMTPQEECLTRFPEVLPLILHCAYCTSVSTVVMFAMGGFLDHIEPQPLRLVSARANPDGRPTTRRFIVDVHKDVLSRGAGKNLIAIFTFQPMEGTIVRRFAARPRTLVRENDWYVYQKNSSDSPLVYAAMQLPEEQDKRLHELIIDVECEGCDKDGATVRYSSAASDWKNMRQRKLFERFWTRDPIKRREVSIDSQPCATGAHCWQLIERAEVICGDRFDGGVQFYAKTPVTEKNFHWMVTTSNELYPARLGMSKTGTQLVKWKGQDRWNLCAEPEAFISLHVSCNHCALDTQFQVYTPTRPAPPAGASSEIVANLTASWHETTGCSTHVANGGPKSPFYGTPRLWVDPYGRCYSKTINYKATANTAADPRLDILTEWQQRYAIHNRNKTRPESPDSFFNIKFDVPKCLCEKIRGIVYRRVDWDVFIWTVKYFDKRTPADSESDDSMHADAFHIYKVLSKPDRKKHSSG